MKARMSFSILLVFTLALGSAGVSSAAGKARDLHVATGPMDDGRLQPDWFGSGMAFVETDQIDYLWVKDGFEIVGKTLHFVEWPEPTEFIGERAAERDEKDHRTARQMSGEIANSFVGTWNAEFPSQLPSSMEEGQIEVVGRIADCSAGNRAAKMVVGFGAGAGGTTVDMKFIDKSSGEVVMAIHSRVLSGTSWSTTDSKFFKWMKKVGKELSRGSQVAYAKGDPQRK